MTRAYKLPACWLGKAQVHNGAPYYVTADDVNLDCTCTFPVQAFLCAEGHLTECHKGKSCREADCSHLERYEDPDAPLHEDPEGEP